MKTPLILAAAGFALTASVAQAETRAVAHDDLNLATPEGQAALTKRVDKAARQICGYKPGKNRSLIMHLKARDCFESARARASEQVAARIEEQSLGG